MGADVLASRPRFWTRARKRLWGFYVVAGALLAAHGAIADWRANHAFVINVTDSLPNWAFIVENNRAPGKGEYVFFNPPRSPLVLAHFGAEPAMFGKVVRGVPGDVVTRDGATFYVNGEAVAVAKPVSLRGKRLEPGPTGVIPRDCYFVATPHKDGFDSRYADIGWICRERLIGIGSPIL